VDLVALDQRTFSACTPWPSNRQVIECVATVLRPGNADSVRVIVHPLRLVADGTTLLLTVQADPYGAIRERSETNNTTSSARVVRVWADLRLTGTLEIRDNPQCLVRPLWSVGRTRWYIATLKIRNDGPGQSLATSLWVTWQGTNIRTLNGVCSGGQCLVQCSCLDPRAGAACPTYNFAGASVPVLAPGSEVQIVSQAMGDIPGLGRNQVEFGSVTLDPERRVRDPDRRNNVWVMHP
jgi:hypothetical protein